MSCAPQNKKDYDGRALERSVESSVQVLERLFQKSSALSNETR